MTRFFLPPHSQPQHPVPAQVVNEMDMEELRTFLVVVRTNSFGAASRELHRTQPAISRRITSLEARYGAPLLERLPSGVKLTAAGRAVLPFAELMVSAVEDSRKACRNALAGSSERIVLAVVGTLVGHELARCLSDWRAHFPGSEIRVVTANSPDVEQQVATGDADIGLRYECCQNAGTAAEPAGIEEVCFVCAPDAPFGHHGPVSTDGFRDHAWITFRSGRFSRSNLEKALAGGSRQQPHAPIRLLECDSLTAQKALVQAGLGVAAMPLRFVRDDLCAGTLRRFEIDGVTMSMPIYVAIRRGGFTSAALRGLMASIVSAFQMGHA